MGAVALVLQGVRCIKKILLRKTIKINIIKMNNKILLTWHKKRYIIVMSICT